MTWALRAMILLLSTMAVAGATQWPKGRHPVVVAGPLMGQSLEVMNSDDSSWCNTKGKWQWTWGSPTMMDAKSAVVCMLADLGLQGWDDKEKLSIPWPKIKVRPLGGYVENGFPATATLFGGGLLDGAGHLTPGLEKLGYVKNETYFAHAYDWRLGVHDWEVSSFPVLRKVIEKATSNAGGAGAVVTGISMAGPYLHSFISWARREDPSWPAKHIHAFVPVGAPFNGAVMALSAVISSALQTWSSEGDCPNCSPPRHHENLPDEAKNIIDQFKGWMTQTAKDAADEVLKGLIQSWPSIYFMSTTVDYSTDPPTDREIATMVNGAIPEACTRQPQTSTKCGSTATRDGTAFDNPKFLTATQCAECYNDKGFSGCAAGYEKAYDGWRTDLCCKKHNCDAKTYRASELPQLFRAAGREKSAQLMEYASTVGTTADPGVPVHCIFSYNVQTFDALSFATREDLDKTRVTFDDGDQTVDAHSLEVCTRWKSTVKAYKLPGVKHSGLLDVQQTIDLIAAVATNDEEMLKNWKEPAMSDLKWTTNTSLATIPELLRTPAAGLLSFV